MIFFAEITINIASFCITCNGSIAVQSLKNTDCLQDESELRYKEDHFPMSQNNYFLRVFNFKKLVNFFYKGVQTKIHYYIFVKYSMRI